MKVIELILMLQKIETGDPFRVAMAFKQSWKSEKRRNRNNRISKIQTELIVLIEMLFHMKGQSDRVTLAQLRNFVDLDQFVDL